MNCMKCGREIEEGQAFCPYCLVDMESYPVKPGTVIFLPNQQAQPQPPKKSILRHKPQLPPEEQLPALKRKLWVLRAVSVLLIILLTVLGYITSRVITELDIQRLLGQNYSTVETEETEETQESAAAASED